jgi:hypothetical protein
MVLRTAVSVRTWAAIALAAIAALVLTTSTLSAQSGAGRVRVMHASPDTPPVDIFVDGAKAVTGLAFPANTGYVSLPAGTHNVKVFVSPSDGSGTPALEADLDVVAGKDYTVLAVGLVGDGSLALLPLEDNNATPANGKAHIRLIHASPDAPAVDVAVAGTSSLVFSNVAFKGVGAYTPVDAGTYDLEVRPAGTTTIALTIDNLALANQNVYTAVAVGLLADNSLQVVPLLDAAAPAATPTPAPTNPPAPHAPNTGSGLASGSGPSSLVFIGLGVLAMVIAGATVPALLRVRRS